MIKRGIFKRSISINAENKKSMSKQNKKYHVSYALRALVVIVAVATVIGGATMANADKYDDQINALSSQNATAAGVLNEPLSSFG